MSYEQLIKKIMIYSMVDIMQVGLGSIDDERWFIEV
jgi:hypothetical protein